MTGMEISEAAFSTIMVNFHITKTENENSTAGEGIQFPLISSLCVYSISR